MMKLSATIRSGFPSTQHQTDPTIRSFFNVRQHLWLQGHTIMFKDRIVIPRKLRDRCLDHLHSAH